MVRYGIFRCPVRNGGASRFRRASPALAFRLRPTHPEAPLALPVPPSARLGVRVPAVGLAAKRPAALPAAHLRAVLMTVIADRAENDLNATPLADEDPTP